MVAVYILVLLLISFTGALISAKRKFANFESRPVHSVKRKHLPRHGVLYVKHRK